METGALTGTAPGRRRLRSSRPLRLVESCVPGLTHGQTGAAAHGPSPKEVEARRLCPKEQGPQFSLGALRDEPLAPTCCGSRLRRKEKRRPFGAAFWDKNPGDDLLLHGLGHTTIGAAAFHFRVRDGIGWFHSAMVARERVEGRSGSV